MIKCAIKELTTNHGGIVTASKQFWAVCHLWYTLKLSRKNTRLKLFLFPVSDLVCTEVDLSVCKEDYHPYTDHLDWLIK